MTKSFWTLIVLVFVLELQDVDASDQLKFVHIIYRHGDRTPTGVIPTDSNNQANAWYNGLGELTPNGMKRSYQLGKWLRTRFDGYINSTFDQSQIYVRSTDYNRTIMSALSNLAGLYPPQGQQIWNANIPWQPIPVHTRDKMTDIELWTDRPCPTVSKRYNTQVLTLPAMQNATAYWAPVFNFVGDKSGIDLNWANLNHVEDPATKEWMDRTHRNISTWLNVSIVNQLYQMFDTKVKLYYFGSHGILRLRGGPLLKDIVTRMNEKMNNRVDPRLKMYFYSAHDTTVVALLKSLGVVVEHAVSYSCAIIIELFQSSSGIWKVKTSFKNDVGLISGGGAPTQINVGGCENNCTLDRFTARSQTYFTTDWYEECGLNTEPIYLELLTVVSCVAVALLAAVVILYIQNRGLKRAEKTKL